MAKRKHEAEGRFYTKYIRFLSVYFR